MTIFTRSLTNTDNSEIVIKQMRDRYNTYCPDMRWLQVDLTSTTFENEEFTCVLDKATLDAIMTDGSPEVVSVVNKYFSVCLILRSSKWLGLSSQYNMKSV